MITSAVLTSTFIISYNYHFLFVVRTFNVYSLKTFKYILLTIFTMLYITSSELTHLITGGLYTLTSFPPPPAHDSYPSTLCLYEFHFFRFHI